MTQSADRKPSVLLVEDHEATGYIYKAGLEFFGLKTEVAANADAACRLARELLPDVILLDIGLPGKQDGFDVAESLKAEPKTKHIPIVAITVHVFEHDEQRAREAGCDYFVRKPYPPIELAEFVRNIIAQTQPS